MNKLFQDEKTRAIWQIAVRKTHYKETGEMLPLDLSGANLYGADLYGADLYGADLRVANLHVADLRYADLSGADLRGADLSDADLSYAYLRFADLRDADLRGANFRDADLSGADLRDADLYGADLYGADLCDAKFNNCIMNWYSHKLISARLLQCEGTIEQHAYASLIAVKTDWCWKEWLDTANVPENVIEWALSQMREWVRDGDNVPSILMTNKDKD